MIGEGSHVSPERSLFTTANNQYYVQYYKSIWMSIFVCLLFKKNPPILIFTYWNALEKLLFVINNWVGEKLKN